MIFDSDVLVWFSRDEPDALELADSTSHRLVSVVTVMELLQGARSRLDASKIKNFLMSPMFEIVPLSERIGGRALELIENYALSSGLHVEDALIAATALETGQVLATANVRHFRAIAGLHLQQFRPRH